MNILYFCQLYPPAVFGGGEYIFYQWARELVKRGHNVFTITQRLHGQNDFDTIEGIKVYRVGPAIKYRGALPTTIKENAGYILDACRKGLGIAKTNRIDVIHSNTYAPTFAGQFCATFLRRPHLITVHDVYFRQEPEFWKKWSLQKDVQLSNSLLGPIIERVVMKLPATIFHTVSRTSKKDLLANKVKRISVIPNGLDPSEYQSSGNLSPKQKQAIYVGRIVFYKNLDTVINAFNTVVQSLPDAKLLIVGNGPYRKDLESLVERLGLRNNVSFMGTLTHEEKVRLIYESSFLILPSICEGFGIVVIEAFACSRPAMVSTVMPLPEIVESSENGFCLPPYDVDAWSKTILDVFTQPEMAMRLGQNANRDLRSKYTIEKVVDQIEQLYMQLPERRPQIQQ